jgi:DNA-binding CsgD family transcriptional regulator
MIEALDKFERLETLAVNAVVLDRSGKIVGVNDAWKSFGRRNGLRLPKYGIGANYLAYCGTEQRAAPTLAQDLRELLAGRRDMVTTTYPCHSPTVQRWFFLIGFPLSFKPVSGVAILHAELTKLLPLPGIPSTLARKGKQDASGLMSRIADTVEASVSNSLASQLAAMMQGPSKSAAPSARGRDKKSHLKLSKRQMQILELLGEGKTNAEIAKELFRSPHTIKLHVSAILKQLNVKSRTQAALIASSLPRKPEAGKGA